MNRLYTGILLLCTMAAASCGSKQLRIENINNRQALDSLIATLPKTQVKVDSIPVRTLVILLKGDFTYYGQPVKKLLIETKDELLSRFSFNTEKGALDVLNSLESANGAGLKEYSSADLSWKTVEKNIQFGASDFGGDLLTLSNKEKASISLYFNNPANNRISNIYKELQPTATTNNYKLEVDNDECGYRVYVNGFLAIDHPGARTFGVTENINQYLVKGKQQNITVELLPGNDFQGNPRSRLSLESVVHVTLNKWSESSIFSPVVLDFRTPYADTSIREDAHSSRYTRASKFYGQPAAKVERTFQIEEVPYELPCYASAATDIRKVPDAKEKILAHYHQLQDAYTKKNPQELDRLLYPVMLNTQMAWHCFKPTDAQTTWKKILENANDAAEVKLSDNVTLYITPDGRFAKLLPADKSDKPAFYLLGATDIYPLDYYVSINKNGEVQFALN
jgi:hypothetical protein